MGSNFPNEERSDHAGGPPPVRLNLVLGRGIPVELDVKIDDGIPDTGALRLTVSSEATLGESTCVRTGGGGTRIYDVGSGSQDCNVTYLY